jgi:hypothetical protein
MIHGVLYYLIGNTHTFHKHRTNCFPNFLLQRSEIHVSKQNNESSEGEMWRTYSYSPVTIFFLLLDMPVCIDCNAVFDTKGEVNYHVRLEHQKTVDMVCPVTKEIVVVPRVGRDFHCRSVNCSFSTPVPQQLREHKRCF